MHEEEPRPTEHGPHPQHARSEEHTSELQSRQYLVCRLLLEKNNWRSCRSTPRVSVATTSRRAWISAGTTYPSAFPAPFPPCTSRSLHSITASAPPSATSDVH